MRKLIAYQYAGPCLPPSVEVTFGNATASCPDGVTEEWLAKQRNLIGIALHLPKSLRERVVIISIMDLDDGN